jgi:NTP pyrophosphatase (non-canonical NTP hydrolase)
MPFWKDFFKLFTYGPQEPLVRKQPPPIPQEPMALGEYQKLAFTVAKYPEHGTGSIMAVVYCGLGLGEAGEVQGKIKKVLRDSKGQITPEIKEALIAEMGDNLWYIAALATELGVTLDEVGKKNLDKLFDRAERGVIGGSGDKR